MCYQIHLFQPPWQNPKTGGNRSLVCVTQLRLYRDFTFSNEEYEEIQLAHCWTKSLTNVRLIALSIAWRIHPQPAAFRKSWLHLAGALHLPSRGRQCGTRMTHRWPLRLFYSTRYISDRGSVFILNWFSNRDTSQIVYRFKINNFKLVNHPWCVHVSAPCVKIIQLTSLHCLPNCIICPIYIK